jgi:hypothetical protein
LENFNKIGVSRFIDKVLFENYIDKDDKMILTNYKDETWRKHKLEELNRYLITYDAQIRILENK